MSIGDTAELPIKPKLKKERSYDPKLDRYILLEGRVHGIYSYPDILVAKEKSHFDNTLDAAQFALQQNNHFMLTLRQFVDFLHLLKSNKIYDGNGTAINSSECNKILDDIITLRDPWRAEWIDAYFTGQRNQFYIEYHIPDSKGMLHEIKEPLEDCLMKNTGIDLDSWLETATYQGLPSKHTKKGPLYYWHPLGGAVARFYASSGGVGLNCSRDPSFSYPALGVHAARTP